MRKRLGRRSVSLAMVGVLAMSMAACGSGSSDASDPGSNKGGGTVTIAIGAAVPDFMQPYIARAKGYFTSRGVDVKFMENTGPSTLNAVVSGQADLALTTAPSALQAATQGKSTSIVYAVERDPGAALVTTAKITSLDQLKSRDRCRLSTFPANSQIYSYALVYKKALGLKCDLTVVNQNPLALAGLASGTNQAAILTATTAAQAKAAGANILIDPTNPDDAKAYLVPPYPTAVLFGMSDNLKSKKDSISRFLGAMDDANTFLHKASTADLTNLLHGIKSFSVTPKDVLQSQVDLVVPYVGAGLGTPAGSISSDLWANALKQYANWGIAGFDAAADINSYGKRVDMSYLDAALD